MNFPGVLNSSSLRIHLRVEITNAGGMARGHTGRNIGQKSIEISWKSSQKWKSEKSSCRARAAFLLRIAPFTIANYKAWQGRPCFGASTLRPAASLPHREERYSAARPSVRTHAPGFCTKLTPSLCWLGLAQVEIPGYEIGGNKRLVEIPLGLLPPSKPTKTWSSRD